MANFKLKWDQTGDKIYETGIDRGVLYTDKYAKATAWNGLTAFTEAPEGAEPTPFYADNTKYLNLLSAEEFGGTIEAYTYPEEFEECDGSKQVVPGVTVGQQERKMFGFSYRTRIGNDEDADAHGYKLHLVYGCLASPSEKSYQTVNDTPEPVEFSWEISTTPVEVPGAKPTALMTIDSRTVDTAKLAALEKILYGDSGESEEGRLPLPTEIITLLGD